MPVRIWGWVGGGGWGLFKFVCLLVRLVLHLVLQSQKSQHHSLPSMSLLPLPQPAIHEKFIVSLSLERVQGGAVTFACKSSWQYWLDWYIFVGFPGVEIGSHINEWNLNAPELFPIFQVITHECQERNSGPWKYSWYMVHGPYYWPIWPSGAWQVETK